MKCFSFLLLICLIILSNINSCKSTAKSQQTIRCDSTNCKLPLCKCSDTQPPGDIDLDKVPMMIGLSFNGIIASSHMKYIKQILNPVFKNPNGCPIQGSFFVSEQAQHDTTDYCVVQNLFNNNNEIGVGATKYSCPYTDCDSMGRHFRPWKASTADKLIYDQKKNIARSAKINRSFLRGFRLPKMGQDGNAHFGSVKKFAFNYDSSAIVKLRDIMSNDGNMRFWPHTLDFPPTYECSTCPTKESLCRGKTNCTMNSVWVVPVHTLGVEGKNPCPTLIKDEVAQNRIDTKDCVPRRKLTQKILEEMLFTNFMQHYKLNKAPFIINIETEWFNEFGEMLTEALKKFVNDLTDSENKFTRKGDIYFLGISKIVEWIQYPNSLDVIGETWLWDCDGASYDYDEECQSVLRLQEKMEELEEIKKKNKTMELDLQAEKLFHNGVLSAAIVAFALFTSMTICYDKYG